MSIIDDLLKDLPDGSLREVRMGAFWTAVVVEVGGKEVCGLATTMTEGDDHHHSGRDSVLDAGRLLDYGALELASLAKSDSSMEASLGFAAVNALLPKREENWVDLNAEHVVVELGAGKRVAVVGHFPFVARWREIAAQVWVVEKRPRGEDLPAEAAADILPQADIVAITGTSLINHTFEDLLAHCRQDALLLVLGPSTPLSPVLFEYGVDIVSGAVVEDTQPVLRAVSQGANFRQVHRQGVRLVTMRRS